MIDTQKMGHPSEMPVGNEAKLRETLVAVKKSIDDIGASSLDGDPEILMMSLTQVCARLSARIDAALAAPATTEKSSAVGDRAKLREVLEHIVNERDILDFCHNNLGSKTPEDWDKVYMTLRKWIDEAMSALATPPRNCDKYSHDEALNIWAAENENERNGCFDEWLYHESTEQEGGNDGNE